VGLALYPPGAGRGILYALACEQGSQLGAGTPDARRSRAHYGLCGADGFAQLFWSN